MKATLRGSHKSKTMLFLFGLVIVASLFLVKYYPWFFTRPNEVISTVSGDGLKSYFVSISYIKNQDFSNEFKGMNYPNGVTMIYTDGNPGLTFLCKAISTFIPSAADHFVAFYNVSILLSYLLSAILFFFILKSFYVPDLFAAAGAITITMLSPQMFRVLGHPSFAFVVFFPLAWFLLIRFFSTEKKAFITFLILANSCFWFFVQPYYLMIITMFYFFSWLIYFLKAKNRNAFLRKILFAACHIIVPVILVKTYLLVVDHHPIRPQFPGGFFEFNAKFETVFAPYYSPLTDIFKRIFFFSTDNQGWEGWAYIGLSAVIVFFFSIFRMIRYIVKKRIKPIISPVLPAGLENYLWASVIVLLFAMCIPFKWNMHFLLDYLPWLRQFRALGRFAWVFYYVFSVYSVFVLYQVVRKLAGKKLYTLANTLVLLFFAFNFSEAAWYQAQVSDSFEKNANPFLNKNFNEEFNDAVKMAIDNKGHYQCIIPLPYYHSGGEEFEINAPDKTIRLSMLFSLQTQIPLMSNAAARTSIDEGRALINFFAPPFMERKIGEKLNRKKFLLMYTGEEINPFEKEIFQKAVLIKKTQEFELYELSYDSVFNPGFDKKEWLKNQILYFTEQDAHFLNKNGFTGEVSTDLVFRNFDTLQSDNTFIGQGSFKGNIREYSMVLEPGFYPLTPGKEYVVSYWYQYTGEKSNENTLILEIKDSTDKIISWLFGQSAKESYLSIGDWIFVQRKFRLPDGKNKLDLFFKGKNEDKNFFTMDELMIRPADKNVLSVKSSTDKKQILFFNNIPIDTLRLESEYP